MNVIVALNVHDTIEGDRATVELSYALPSNQYDNSGVEIQPSKRPHNHVPAVRYSRTSSLRNEPLPHLMTDG